MQKLIQKPKTHLLLLISFCILLWIIRVKLTHTLFYGFLIWNLFLAYIPYFISSLVKNRFQNSSKLKLTFILFIWLLFLPNAPYIITDFIHLHHSKSSLVWLDIFLIFSYSSTGLLLAVLSLTDVYKIIKQKWSLKFANYFSISATFLCGFGIYLGRFLRFNSWDVFTNPITLLKQCVFSINDPKTWFITISFGSFLYIIFLFSKSIKSSYNE